SLVSNYPYMVMDNEAGMEHLSRKTTDNINTLILVSNYTVKGLRAVVKIRELVNELKLSIGQQLVLLTSVPAQPEEVMIEEMRRLEIIPAAFLPFDRLIQQYDYERKPLLDLPDEAVSVTAINKLVTDLLRR